MANRIIPVAFVVLCLVMSSYIPFINNSYAQADVQIYGVVGDTDINSLDDGAGAEIGTGSTLINQTFNRISVPMYKIGSPTQTIYIGVFNATIETTVTSGEPTNAIEIIGTLEAEDLTASVEFYTFTFSGHTISEGEVIGIFADNTGQGGSNLVIARRSASNEVSGAIYSRDILSTGGTWVDQSGDFAMLLTSTNDAVDVSCIDTNLNGDLDLCFTDTNGDGVPDNGQAGALGAFNSNANVTQLGTQWFCAFNIGDACDNEDVKTNGVGVLYTLLIIIFSYALLVSIHIMAVRQLHKEQVQVMDMININPILLIIVLFLDVGFAWYLGFIADEIFYTAMVIPLGLSALGIFKAIRGR